MPFHHKHLASGGWQKLTLQEQLGNIGSEVLRASRAQGKDETLFWAAVERALELFDFVLEDPRWNGRHSEISRAKEVFVDAVFGGREYKSTLPDLVRYFDHFAYAARLHA